LVSVACSMSYMRRSLDQKSYGASKLPIQTLLFSIRVRRGK
jgi:hypothetical protein